MGKGYLNSLHIISWLIKDAMWCLHFTPVAIFMIFPTLILSTLVLIKDPEDRLENSTLIAWILMNCFWMLHELANWPFYLVFIPMIVGLVLGLNLLVTKVLK